MASNPTVLYRRIAENHPQSLECKAGHVSAYFFKPIVVKKVPKDCDGISLTEENSDGPQSAGRGLEADRKFWVAVVPVESLGTIHLEFSRSPTPENAHHVVIPKINGNAYLSHKEIVLGYMNALATISQLVTSGGKEPILFAPPRANVVEPT